jgi:four helix bundle protein
MEPVAGRFTAAKQVRLADQLTRAAEKIPSQIAEGYGRWYPRDKVQFYRWALGSVNECVGHLDAALQKGLLSAAECDQYVDALNRIGKMLQRLIQSALNREDGEPGGRLIDK